MPIGKDILARLGERLNISDYRKTHWEGGFAEYLDIVREHPEVTLFPRDLFSPYLWDEPRPASYDRAYAVHHWAMSWRER